jgi:hypothetical protein
MNDNSDGGYVFGLSDCLICQKSFPYNPHRVPSFRIDGVKEPVCGSCMVEVNAEREKLGLEAFVIPTDAYEPIPVGEL